MADFRGTAGAGDLHEWGLDQDYEMGRRRNETIGPNRQVVPH